MDFRGIRQIWKTTHKAISFYYSIKITDMYNILKIFLFVLRESGRLREIRIIQGLFGWVGKVSNGFKPFDTVGFSGLLYKVKLLVGSVENKF
jgi:hypothetical protein